MRHLCFQVAHQLLIAVYFTNECFQPLCAISSGEIASVMQSAEPRHSDDFRIHRHVVFGSTLSWCLLFQSKMRPVVMVIAEVFVHQAFQMALIENDDMIEQVSATASYETFANAILPWSLKAASLRLNAEVPDGFEDLFVEVRSAVKD